MTIKELNNNNNNNNATMITTEKLTELRDRAYRAACDKGFHDEQKPDAVYKMLIITEIAEAVQADRKRRRVTRKVREDYEQFMQAYNDISITMYESAISGTLEDELADVIIRMLDYCGMKKIEFREDNDGFPFDRLTAFRTFPEAMYDLCGMITREDLLMEVSLRCVIYYCESLGIDILWFVEMKMRYNESRPRMHNRKY